MKHVAVNNNFHLNLKWRRQQKKEGRRRWQKSHQKHIGPASKQTTSQAAMQCEEREWICFVFVIVYLEWLTVAAMARHHWPNGPMNAVYPGECVFSLLSNKLNVSLLFWWHVKMMILKPFHHVEMCVCLFRLNCIVSDVSQYVRMWICSSVSTHHHHHHRIGFLIVCLMLCHVHG